MCWIVWVYNLDGNNNNLLETATDLLRWNKNRGQNGYWLSVLFDDWKIETFKFEELNKEVQEEIENTKWKIVWIIWHARYPTSWWSTETNPEYNQPFELNHLKHWMAFAFNWNIVNAEELAIELEKQDKTIEIKRPILDTNVLKHMILSKVKSWVTDLKEILEYINDKIDWACNILLLSKDWNMAFSKDKWWFRPLSWEELDWNLILSSESSALFKAWGDDNPNFVRASQIVQVDSKTKEVTTERMDIEPPKRKANCFFEAVYFTDSKTILWWRATNSHRHSLWSELSKTELEDFNSRNTVVIDIPSSSLYASEWYSSKIKLPLLSPAITKNPDIWRTFIADNATREEKIKAKYIFNPNLKKYIKWKKVVLIDDSVVRGSTMKYLVSAFCDFYEPLEIHLRIPSPAVTSPCYYWINMAEIEELVVRKYFEDVNNPTEIELKALANDFWANSIKYIRKKWLIKALRVETKELCLGCITWKYPTEWWRKKYQQQILEYNNWKIF